MPAGYEFERCFIRVAVRLAEGQGKSKTDLAKAIFGESVKAPYRTLQAMLVPSKPAQVSGPRKLLLRESYSAAKALGMRLSDLILLTESETGRSQEDESLLHDGLASA